MVAMLVGKRILTKCIITFATVRLYIDLQPPITISYLFGRSGKTGSIYELEMKLA